LTAVDDRSTIILMADIDTKQVLIEQGLKALLMGGYDGLSIGPVLAAAGVPKGSFYYFFPSKDHFIRTVLKSYAARYARLRDLVLTDRTKSPLRRLRAYFDKLEQELASETPLGGCLYGVLAQTAGIRSKALREQLLQSFQAWEESLIVVLKQAQEAGELNPELDAKAVAAFLIDAYEGALIRMKSDGDTAAFGRFRTFALEPLLARKPRVRTARP
jgi:TetR/AcrR family transcriptional repressor of nem operon